MGGGHEYGSSPQFVRGRAGGGGLAAEITVDPAVNPTDVFDGWVPAYGSGPPPAPEITVQVPASRANHEWALFSDPARQPASYPWPNPEPHYGWPSPLPASERVVYAGVDGMADYAVDFHTFVLPNSTPYFGGPFLLQDMATLEPHDVSAGPNDLRQWFTAEQAVNLEISTSRFGHQLRVRHPNGGFFAITQLPPAVNGSLGPNRTIFEVPYYFFNATASARTEMPWYVEDVDADERIGPSAGQSYPNNDDLIRWIYVTPPSGLTAIADAAGIDLAWVPGEVTNGGGFIIERRESLLSEGPFTRWHELERVPASRTDWTDIRLVPGEYAIYRVRAFFGKDADEHRSPPSNRARAAMWIDLDKDGDLESPGGDDGTAEHPVLDPPGEGDDDGSSNGGDGGSGNGGYTIPGDGDGDGNPDNDKDGVVDTADRYLNDALRSDDIPVKFHGVVDLSKYLVAPDHPPFDAGYAHPHYAAGTPLITINDEGRVAWAGIYDSGETDPAGGHIMKLRCITWQDGQITSDKRSPLTATGTKIPRWDTTPRKYIRSYVLDPVGISQARVVGNVTCTELWEDPVSHTYHTSLGQIKGTFDRSLSEEGSPTGFTSVGEGEWVNENLQISRGDHLLMIRRWKTPGGGPNADHQEAKIDNNVAFADGTFKTLYSFAMSDAGYAVVHAYDANGENPKYYLCSPDGTKTTPTPTIHERMWVSGVNDQKWIIGDQSHFEDDPNGGPEVLKGYEKPEDDFDDAAAPGKKRKGRGTLGFLWSQENGFETFHDKLPKEFRKQVRSAVPTMITNADPVTHKPRIVFYAKDYEGATGEWKDRLMILRWNANGDPSVDRIMLPAASVNSTTHVVQEKDLWLATTNTAQDIVGSVEGKPAIARSVEFKAREPFSDGVDPPMVGDVDNLTETEDEEDWAPWTSVAKSGSLYSTGFTVNSRTKLVVASDQLASQLEIVAVDDNGTVSTSDITVTPGILLASQTNLEITGKNGGPNPNGVSVIRNATVLVRMRDDTKQVLYKMRVMVLPPAPVKFLRFYEFANSTAPGDQIPQAFPTRNVTGLGIASPTDIIDQINRRFTAAAVKVESALSASWVTVVNHWDWNGTHTFSDYEGFVDPAASYNTGHLLAGDCNIFLFPHLGSTSRERGKTLAAWLEHKIFANGQKIVVVAAWDFQQRAQGWSANDPDGWSRQDPETGTKGTMERAIAHEFGHFLSLATREWKPLDPDPIGGHDDLTATNNYPDSVNGKKLPSLMKSVSPPGPWLRHEDWKAANERARK